MKKLILVFLGSLSVTTVFGQIITFSSPKPQIGKPLAYTVQTAGTPLENTIGLKTMVLRYDAKGRLVSFDQVKIEKEGNLYKGIIPGDSLSLAMVMVGPPSDLKIKPRSSYVVYHDNKKILPAGLIAEAQLLSGLGGSFGVASNLDKAIAAFERAFKINPALKLENLPLYLGAYREKDKVRWQQEVDKAIDQLTKIDNPTERQMVELIALYDINGQDEKAEALDSIILQRFPLGRRVFIKRLSALFKEKNALSAETKLKDLQQDFDIKPTDAKLKKFVDHLTLMFGMEGNQQKFDYYASLVKSKVGLASLYNQVAWPLAEKKEHVDFAAALSKKSLAIIEEERQTIKNEAALANLNRSWDLYADTYALLLHHQGNDKEAVFYQEKVLASADDEGKARYAIFLNGAGQADKAFEYAAMLIEKGNASADLVKIYKDIYLQKGKSDFDAHYASLQKKANDVAIARLQKDLINEPAPDFELKNLKGETVSLAALKGKIVVLDYWATWCGPCVSSFPAMQKAVDKYKSNPNVVFLFINTWQKEKDREKVVQDFMDENPYTFNVLLDTKNKENPQVFDVVNAYKVSGIPTKFVIDGKGNIRFKKTGFGGSAEATVKELETMIEMVNN